MADKECCRYSAHPVEKSVCSLQPFHSAQHLCYQDAEQTDEERHEGPAQHASAETVDDGSAEDNAKGVGCVVMESHENLLAIAGIKNADAEWQHAAHEVVAIAVHRLTVGRETQLKRQADHHQHYGESPVATVDEEAVNDVELQHQTEEPEWTGPDDAVGIGQYVVEHAQHGDDVERLIVMRPGSEVVEHGKCDEPHNHHLEELEVVIAYESQSFTQIGQVTACDAESLCALCEAWTRLVFQHQSVGAEEEKYGHSIMSEE